ncbi:ABC transporter permease [Streptosporangiaceae bacterium NEAU-GS5]|nr:ABC transporter permease [Streptosporangiaceae bacterium NEAU-GS5]
MTVIAAWLRLERKRRWRSLAVLALLVAFATATVMAGMAGARRGASAVDRLWGPSLPATAAVLPNQPGFDWSKIRQLPEVEALTEFPISIFWVAEIPWSQDIGSVMGDAEALHTIERPAILAGRLPDPRRMDEVVVSPGFPARYHKGVGDRLTIALASPEQAASDLHDPAEEPKGPRIPATIVGVVRSPWFSPGPGQPEGVLSTPAVFQHYRANFLGPNSYVNAIVRLKHGTADLETFRRDLGEAAQRDDIVVWDLDAMFRERAARVSAFEASSLLAFGLAALFAAVVLIGQSVARYAAAVAADLDVLRSLGLGPRQSWVTAAAGPALAAVAGSTLAVVAAAVASLWMPIGVAATIEPHPGLDLDWPILAGGWVLVPLLVFAGTAGSSALLTVRGHGAGRRSFVARAAAGAGLPVAVTVGARFAFEPGRGSNAVPVRPALIGAMAGVLGVAAALVFSAGVRDAADNPARFGRTHQVEAFDGLNGKDLAPVSRVVDAFARDPDVVSVLDAREGVLEAGRYSITTFTYASAKRPFPVVLTAGSMPARADEIALAPGSAEALKVGVGGIATFDGRAAPIRLKVTGIAFVPVGSHNRYNDGGWLTPQGHDQVFQDATYAYKFRTADVVLRPGADATAVAARLQAAAEAAGAEGLQVGPPEPMDEVAIIRDVQALPLLLAAFLAALALGAVGHALVTAVRRRRHEMAVLRALGMTRRQVRAVVFTQATLVAAVALGFGVPLGVAIGRVLWRTVAGMLPLWYVPPAALVAVLLITPVTLLLANALAMWPGRQAAGVRIGHVLRTE